MNWVAYPITALLLIVATALQNTWPGWLLLLGRGPDVALTAVVAVAISGGPVLGCFAGLMAGLFVPASQSLSLGAFLLTYMLAGTVVGLMRGMLLADRLLVPMLIVLVTAPLAEAIRMIIAPPLAPAPWMLGALVTGIYSAVAAAPVHALVRLITEHCCSDQ
ncbi:MAG: hypothetical protein J7M38_01605 [Armatimonadetes bacterium]|nr:hypothetical protein [Armatimonadota bacterium]